MSERSWSPIKVESYDRDAEGIPDMKEANGSKCITENRLCAIRQLQLLLYSASLLWPLISQSGITWPEIGTQLNRTHSVMRAEPRPFISPPLAMS